MRIEIVSNGAKETYEIPDQLGRELWKQLVEAKKSGTPKNEILCRLTGPAERAESGIPWRDPAKAV